jgi:endoglucanase
MLDKKTFLFLLVITSSFLSPAQSKTGFIRINLLGYFPGSSKTAVWCSKEGKTIEEFYLVDTVSKKKVYKNTAGKNYGSYGPFKQTQRLIFSAFIKPGSYYIEAGTERSPVFKIDDDVYKGAANFCLRYMRQQRSGFNPFLKDSCHTQDGYILYGAMAGIKDSTHVDVVGGWHDASDYLQYAATSANATYHLLAACRDFPKVFPDEKLANGSDGKNGLPDVFDEAKWGVDWLLKMHPSDDVMFNQVGDDRDHMGMRIPKEDSFYGKGYERPVYFITGEPQQRGKFWNNTTGTSSTAGKFAAVFAFASEFYGHDTAFRSLLLRKAFSAYYYGMAKPGYTQTVSVRSPYIYAEENWLDDMELAAAMINQNLVIGSRYAFFRFGTEICKTTTCYRMAGSRYSKTLSMVSFY